MAGSNKQNRVLVGVGIGAALSALVVYWLARLLREEEEFERAVRVPPVRPEEMNIPLSPETLAEAEPLTDYYEVPPVEPAAPASPQPAERLAAAADDLTQIDGIGPKYARTLAELGITTFDRLAEQQPGKLAEQLRAHGARIIGARIESEDWIGQAQRLAAER